MQFVRSLCCPWSPEFAVRSSHLAFGSWQSVARGILKFSSTQAFCSRIVMSTDKFAHMCRAAVLECACESVRVSVCLHTNKQLTPMAISFLVTSKLQVEVRNVAAVAVCYCCYWCFCCCRLQLFKQRLQCAVNR